MALLLLWDLWVGGKSMCAHLAILNQTKMRLLYRTDNITLTRIVQSLKKPV